MSENYKPKKGDRVRVVLEGEATYCDTPGFGVGTGEYLNFIVPTREHVVSVEKVEPPVEVFGPGDTVRRKNTRPAYIYSLGHEGYFSHQVNYFREWSSGTNNTEFTSKHYERLDLK